MAATMQTPTGVQYHEYFAGDTDEIAQQKMNDRVAVLEGRGHKLVKKEMVGRNDPCPCGSGQKYKKCHIGTEW